MTEGSEGAVEIRGNAAIRSLVKVILPRIRLHMANSHRQLRWVYLDNALSAGSYLNLDSSLVNRHI